MSSTSGQSVAELWIGYKERGEMECREQLVLKYAHLVKYLAGRLAIGLPPHVDQEDLISHGYFGLLDAIERFDHRRGIKFETYAVNRIRGSIWDGMRSMDWVPVSVRQRARRLEEAMTQLESSLGRHAEDRELQAALGMEADEYHRLLQELSYMALASLDELWAGENSDEAGTPLIEWIMDRDAEDPLEEAARSERGRRLAEAIDQLPERERIVLTLYYYEDLTVTEIAKVLDLSVSRISQIHTKAIMRLRAQLQKQREVLR